VASKQTTTPTKPVGLLKRPSSEGVGSKSANQAMVGPGRGSLARNWQDGGLPLVFTDFFADGTTNYRATHGADNATACQHRTADCANAGTNSHISFLLRHVAAAAQPDQS